jgi:hypothetical protein
MSNVSMEVLTELKISTIDAPFDVSMPKAYGSI